MTDLFALPGKYVVSRYPLGTMPAAMSSAPALWSLTVTPDEVSLVCPEPAPANAERNEAGWRCWGVVGQLDFALVGILSELTGALARANVSVFALSTFDTDYLLVKDDVWRTAQNALSSAGHVVPPFPD